MWKIVSNIGWIFFDKIFRLILGMLVSVWIARYLGPGEFGILNYALLFPTVFISIAGFGLTNTLTVDFVSANGNSERQHQLVQTGLFVKLVIGILAYVISCTFNYILNSEKAVMFQLINFTSLILILQSSDVIETYFQSQTKAKVSVIVKLIAFVSASIFRVYALINKESIFFLVIINIIELSIAYALMITVYQKKIASILFNVSKNVNLKLIQRLAMVAWPIMVTEFFVFVYMRIDQFMLEAMANSKELGLYGAALRLSETWYFIAGAITTSFYPKIALSWNNNKEKFYAQYQDLLNVLTYISVALAVFVSVFAKQLIVLLYGQLFVEAGIVLSIHIWAGVFVFMGVGTNNLMIIKNLQKFVLLKTVIGATLNVLLNLWLIPRYGALGASVATLVSYGIQAYVLNLFQKDAFAIFKLQSKSFINFITFQNPVSTKFN